MHFLLTLILQIGVILVVSRIVAAAFRRIQQPQVVGEMFAGILLGPSLLGWLAPDVSAFVFPRESLVHLNTLSQVGLVLFMFLVGLEFDPKLMRGRGHAALVTSHVSIIAPFFLGAALALHLYPQLSDSSVSFDGFALFMGAAMSVTAFPVLARILQERNLVRTKVGAVTIACAAVDDVTAWAILAVVIAIVRAESLHTPLWITLAGTVAYVLAMVFLVRPALGLIEKRYHNTGRVTQDLLAVVLLIALASAWTTEYLGIHALFGAFCIGAVMPKDKGLVHELAEKLEHVTVVFLLPIFFANAGLRTQIGLVTGAEMWIFFGLIMLVAVSGKFGGSTIAARMTGLSWRESSALGILMNTRGLMELVILTIGLDLGVISPALFAMMVMMALLTTFMTTPILQWLYPLRLMREAARDESEPDEFTVLVPVSLPASGPGLLRLARALVPSGRRPRVYGLHLRRSDEHAVTDLEGTPDLPAQEFALQPMLRAAQEASVEVRPLVFASERPGRDIADLARVKGADMVLLGWHKPVISRRILGGAVYDVMTNAPADVAVYLERRFAPWSRILVPCRDLARDLPALRAAGRIGATTGVPVTVLHIVPPSGTPSATDVELRAAVSSASDSQRAEVTLEQVRSDDPVGAVVSAARRGEHDLVVVGVSNAWGIEPAIFGVKHERLAEETEASLLILRTHEIAAQRAAVPRPALREAAE
ncbi:cation:proton antiporter [Sandaracinus amylolyticus]|uniref:cation:proton antiporter domain-containing protein n=1 Tax=Sandaracinus amylolyticus TaxID=927083 RepID=UPI001F02CB0D|nr:cation:proton antiporter [Sandaracinus amylolyticus]UJR79582.1 Kef-type K+ transport system membrane component KefB [Sandaracinus amylolyticus]